LQIYIVNFKLAVVVAVFEGSEEVAVAVAVLDSCEEVSKKPKSQ
jgi:hypothetical protein